MAADPVKEQPLDDELRTLLGPTECSDAEAVAALRALCQRSTYVLAKVCGFDKLTVRTHQALCRFMDQLPRRALVLAPRSTFKSTIATIVDTVRLVLIRPDVRILLVSINQDNAANMLSAIQAILEKNGPLQFLFPGLVPDAAVRGRWNRTECTVSRPTDWPEPTITAIGTQSTVVSRHYDVIKNDDLVDEATADSPAELDRALRFYKLEESLLVSVRDGVIQTVGTRWAFHDPYAWILEHEKDAAVFQRGAWNADGSLYFPEQLPEDELERLKRKYGMFLFSALYLNNPVDPDAASFRESWLRWHRVERDVIVTDDGQRIPLAACRRLMRVDPAISEARTAARTAIVVDAIGPDDRLYLLDCWAKRCQPSDMFTQIYAMADRWEVDTVGIEAVAYQRTIKHFLEADLLRRSRWLSIVPLIPDTRKSKEARIRAVQPYLERGQVSVTREATMFLEEYRQFPRGHTVDILDAWAYFPAMWDAPLEDEEPDTERQGWEWETMMGGRNAVTGY